VDKALGVDKKFSINGKFSKEEKSSQWQKFLLAKTSIISLLHLLIRLSRIKTSRLGAQGS